MIELPFLILGRLGNPVGARKKPIEVIETTILSVDHNDGLDFRQIKIADLRAASDGAAKQPSRGDDAATDLNCVHVSSPTRT